MGGSSYDRDVFSSSSSASWGSSNTSASKLSSSSLDSAMNPKGKILRSGAMTPIIIMLDVTGSNINFARLVYDKLPMFYGQIEQKDYAKDFEIAVCAVGDAYTDSYPLQISDFAKGIELDSWMEKLVLEGGGGGQKSESYELAAHYLTEMTEFSTDANPIVFFIGDEFPYPTVDKGQADQFDIPLAEPIDPFPSLRKKFGDNVFMFLNKYNGVEFDNDITQAWESRLAPEHTIKVNEEKAIVDLMLGVLSTIARVSLKTYTIHMSERGQGMARIESVSNSLRRLSNALIPIEQFKTTFPATNATETTSDSTSGKRL
jgi:hypothetical protein